MTISDDLPTRIITGSVQVKPDIREFTANGIVWADGSRTDGVDNVVLATGYLFDFSLVEKGTLIPVHDNQAHLYKNMLPPSLAQWNSLAVIGLVQPSGSILPAAEIQVHSGNLWQLFCQIFKARLFFAALSGQARLPSEAEMERDIQCQQAELAKTFVASTRHTLEVDFVPYMDSLAELLGCKPRPQDFLLSDPRLAHALLFGPNVSYVYRLRGPHPWPKAREAILGVLERTEKCLSGRKLDDARWDDHHSHQLLMMATSLGTVLLLWLFIRLLFY